MNRYFLIFLFLVYGFSCNLLWSMSTEEVKYRLAISRAYVALDKSDLGTAGKIALSLKMNEFGESIPLSQVRGEVFYVLGEVNYQSGFYKLALNNYKDAEKKLDEFVFIEDAFEVLWKLRNLYHRQGEVRNQLDILNRIIDFTRGEETALFKINRGRAYIFLGLLFGERKKWSVMMEQFLKARQNEYNSEVVFLLPAYYFAKYSQEQITKDFVDSHKSQEEIPNKASSFLYYYRLWQDYSKNRKAKGVTKDRAIEDWPKNKGEFPSYKQALKKVINYKYYLAKEHDREKKSLEGKR